MSGFEVAGLVLGAIPLIITAVDNYKTTAKMVKYFRYKEPYIQELVGTLKAQRFGVETELLVIWNKTFSDENLTVPPTSDDLKNPIVTQAIRDYLGDGFDHFVAALAQCERALLDIATSLEGLASNGQSLSAILQANPRKPNGSYEFAKKIKFALKKDELTVLIKDLKDATQNLSRIRDQCLQRATIALQSTSSEARRITSSFDAIRRHACRLYSTISTAYSEDCHPNHQAHLFLQSRSKLLLMKSRTLKKAPVTFRLSFGPVNLTDLCTSEATEVRVLEDTFNRQSSDEILPTLGVPHNVEPPSTRARRVSYQNEPQRDQSSPNDPGQPASPPQIIQDLCLHLSKGVNLQDMNLSLEGNLCYRQCLEKEIQPRVHAAPSNVNVCSLDQVLHPSSTIKLFLNSRLALSSKIASSILQLNETRWYRLPITSDMIWLLCVNPGKPDSEYRPFISRKFVSSSEESSPLNVKRAMLELGIILLELWKDMTFTSYATQLQKQYDTHGARYDVARNWLDASVVLGDILPGYYQVVTRCIECSFATKTAEFKWSDTQFRESVCDYVVKPLGQLLHPS